MKHMFLLIVLIIITLTTQAQHIKHKTITATQVATTDDYHESDDLCYRSNTYIIYLNQTSPKLDTMYIYHIVVPTTQCKAMTKAMTRCKAKTSNANGLCHIHNKIKV